MRETPDKEYYKSFLRFLSLEESYMQLSKGLVILKFPGPGEKLILKIKILFLIIKIQAAQQNVKWGEHFTKAVPFGVT